MLSSVTLSDLFGSEGDFTWVLLSRMPPLVSPSLFFLWTVLRFRFSWSLVYWGSCVTANTFLVGGDG